MTEYSDNLTEADVEAAWSEATQPCPQPAPDAMSPLVEAARALGAIPDGYCFCSANRVGDDSKIHEPECAGLRAALAAMETNHDG